MCLKISFIQETNQTLLKNFSCQGYYGLSLHLTPLSAENRRKTIEGMKIRLKASEGSSKKKRPYKEDAFF